MKHNAISVGEEIGVRSTSVYYSSGHSLVFPSKTWLLRVRFLYHYTSTHIQPRWTHAHSVVRKMKANSRCGEQKNKLLLLFVCLLCEPG